MLITYSLKQHRLRIVLALLLLFVLLLWLLHRYPFAEIIDNQRLSDWVSSAGPYGLLLYVAAGIALTAVGFPRQLLAFVGGYTFGVIIGVVLGTVAAVLGALLTFSVSRRWARAWLTNRYPQPIAQLERFAREDAFLKIVVLRLQPFGTNLLTNLCAGITSMRRRLFATSSMVGFLPQMLVFALSGSGIRVDSRSQLVVSGVLFAVSLLLALYLYRRHALAQQQ